MQGKVNRGICATEREKAAFTVKDPWGLVHEDNAETLRVIGLEASYHEFNGGVILFYQLYALGDNEEISRTILAIEKPVISKTIAWLKVLSM